MRSNMYSNIVYIGKLSCTSDCKILVKNLHNQAEMCLVPYALEKHQVGPCVYLITFYNLSIPIIAIACLVMLMLIFIFIFKL